MIYLGSICRKISLKEFFFSFTQVCQMILKFKIWILVVFYAKTFFEILPSNINKEKKMSNFKKHMQSFFYKGKVSGKRCH